MDDNLGSQQQNSLPNQQAASALTEDIERQLAVVVAASERRDRLYEGILSSTPDLAYVFDRNYRFIYANRALLQMWGRSLEDSIGKSLLEIGYEPWHAEMHEREIDEVVETKQPIRGEVSFPHATLGRRIYDYIFVPVLNLDGEVETIAGTTRDITERKRTEEALRESERRLRELNDTLEQRVQQRTMQRDRVWRNSRDLLVVIGEDGFLRAVNPAWTQILGHEPSEVVGHIYHEFIWPEDVRQTRAAHESAITRRNVVNFANRLRHKDGTPRWISWHTFFEDGSVYAYGRDITAEKEQQAALAAAEEQLRQSQKMEAVGQLTGGLAHDFNNLLAGITGSLELVGTRLAQGRTGDVYRYIAAAQEAAKRAASLTHRLLAYSRRQTLDPKAINVNRLVLGMEDLIRRTVGPSITVSVTGEPDLWLTFADPHQVENSLLNLCINARDAMPDGGRLTIETANHSLDGSAARKHGLEPGDYISFKVTDTGTGMSPDVMARAFDPFFTTKPIGLGTGLGLSMIYGFAKQSGGQVRIHSQVGRGSVVCLYLPRFKGRDEFEGATADIEPAPRARQGETVLVVDDEPTLRMLVTDTLMELGYGAIEAADGATAMTILESEAHIDLLVTDVGLPGGMNGRQLADAGRELRPDLPVLFITGYADGAAIGDALVQTGMQVLTKPFAMQDLAARIKDVISSADEIARRR